jgi:hypothetical protein
MHEQERSGEALDLGASLRGKVALVSGGLGGIGLR